MTEDFKISDHFNLQKQRVLIELVKANKAYFTGVERVENDNTIEAFVLVHKVGEGVQVFKEGDYALVRENYTTVPIKIMDRLYSIVYDTDLVASISDTIKDQLVKQRNTTDLAAKLDIIN